VSHPDMARDPNPDLAHLPLRSPLPTPLVPVDPTLSDRAHGPAPRPPPKVNEVGTNETISAGDKGDSHDNERREMRDVKCETCNCNLQPPKAQYNWREATNNLPRCYPATALTLLSISPGPN